MLLRLPCGSARKARLARLLGALVPLALHALMAGCPGCGQERPDAPQCTTDDGEPVAIGAQVPAPDGCNVCVCTTSQQLRCTTGPCGDPEPEDAGVVDDAGVTDAGTGEQTDAGVDAGVDLGPCADLDGDGYHPCQDPRFPDAPAELDCDDTRFHVQPGGYEFPETSEDDNCNGTADDWALCPCSESEGGAEQLLSAMDLCGAPLRNVTRSGQPPQFGVMADYQGAVGPRLRAIVPTPGGAPVLTSNGCMASLATGDAEGDGDVDGSRCFPSGHAESYSCGDCPFDFPSPDGQSDVVCDIARIDMVLDVPPNAKGFAFDFMFLSYEWPEFLCDAFNDTFLANVRTEQVNGGQETNAAFDPQRQPITVNVGFFENPEDWTVSLADTTFGGSDPFGQAQTCPSTPVAQNCTLPEYCDELVSGTNGSGSGWLTTSVPVRPGEQGMRITLRIHDEGDSDYDSTVLLDNFRWLPYEPTLETGKGGF